MNNMAIDLISIHTKFKVAYVFHVEEIDQFPRQKRNENKIQETREIDRHRLGKKVTVFRLQRASSLE